MPIAVLTFGFDPIAHPFGDFTVRWGVLALAAILFAALVSCGVVARRSGLRADDLAFIVVGAVPGAVIGGRIGYAFLHWDVFGSSLAVVADPSIGSLELGLAVLGGVASAAYVAHLLGAPVDRWLHVATTPVLLLIGAGKLSMVLTAAGQGAPSSLPWATAYVGPGPWDTLAPDLPSQPSQVYEGFATLVLLTGLTLLLAVGVFSARDGRAFFVGIGAWGVIRAAVSTTWRDPAAALGLPMGGWLSIGLVVASSLAFLWIVVGLPWWRERVRRHADIRWADPETRPRF